MFDFQHTITRHKGIKKVWIKNQSKLTEPILRKPTYQTK